MSKEAIAKEDTSDKGAIDKGLDKLVELRAHAVEKAEAAQDEVPEEEDERRPLWVRLAILSVPFVIGAVVRRAIVRRNGAKAAAHKASQARKKASHAKAARA